MKIIGTTNKKLSCIWTTIGKSIEQLGRCLDLPTIIYDFEDFASRNIKPETDKVIFIFESGTPQHAGLSMLDMKRYFPNSVFITLSSDAIIYIKEHKRNQLDYEYIDILMDVEDEALEHYCNLHRNLIGEKWLWTTSCWMHNRCLEYTSEFERCITKNSTWDFILVGMIGGQYRVDMKNYIESRGYKFTNGGGNGHEDNDLQRLMNHYHRSKITLGTTSHNNPNIRGMKGFRDWIGPLFGAPLIYDNYPQVMGAYGSVVPYYEYGNFEQIISLWDQLWSDDTLRRKVLEHQIAWIKVNTIEEQLYKVIRKYGIL